MRILVTGADGFVGRHLCSYLDSMADDVVAIFGPGTSVAERRGARALDVCDAQAVRDAVAQAKPDAIIHLAGVSSVVSSHAKPADAVLTNVIGTTNVLAAARELTTRPRVLLVSSGEVYGAVPPERRATETSPLLPLSPYAASKVAAETMGLQFARSYGLHVVCARPFNHLGAGQTPTFAIPSFASQIAAARRPGGKRTLDVGNLEAIRDFSHVRDVIAAYRLLVDRGVAGEVYNICSGVGLSLRSVLSQLVELGGVSMEIRVDPARLRPAEIPSSVGDNGKLRSLGWSPQWTVRNALEDVLREAEERISSTPADHSMQRVESTVTAVILCGGRGERLRPFTETLPKPLVPLGDRPLLAHLMDYLAGQGIRRFVLCTGYKREAIESFAGGLACQPWDVACVDSGDASMMDRVLDALPRVSGRALLCYGDTLANIDLPALLAEHARGGNVATVTTHPLESPFGIVDVDDDGFVSSIREKPRLPHWINIGFLLCERGALEAAQRGMDLVSFLQTLVRSRRLRAFRHEGRHLTVNTEKERSDAEKEIVFFTYPEGNSLR